MTGAGEAEEVEPFPEQRFGPYVLKRELASGGMATVYEALRVGDEGFERRVAIKRIHPHLAKDRAFVTMFLDEARLAARIAHPNVCQVLDYGKHAGISFLAMEYLDGRSVGDVAAALARAHADGSAHVRFVASLVMEAAEGLHAAHELRDADGTLLDVVHRDVSPQNLFLTFDGEVKVVDFGVASARDKTHQTETGEIKGKLAYMSPEQIHGRVDRRADVWALGVVLWELLALRRLFRRNSQTETLLAVERDPIVPPSSARSRLTTDLDAICARALARDLAARTPDARTLAEELAAALASLGGAMPRRERAIYLLGLVPRPVDRAPRSTSGSPTLEPGVPPSAEQSAVETLKARARRSGSTPTEPATPELHRSPTVDGPVSMHAPISVDVPVSVDAPHDEVPSGPAGARATPSPAPASRVRVGALVVGALVVGALGLVVATSALGPSATVAPSESSSPRIEPTATLAPPPSRPDPIVLAPAEPRAVAVVAPEAPSSSPTAARAELRPRHPRATEDRGTPVVPSAPVLADPPAAVGPARVAVPMGVVVCFDAPCRDRSEAVFGPRSLMLPSGPHAVYYLAASGEGAGPAVVIARREIRPEVGLTTTVLRP